jgi:hypothetical protein
VLLGLLITKLGNNRTGISVNMRALLFCLTCILTGCASTVTLDSAPDSTLATIVGQIDRTDGMANWRSFVLVSVDGKPVTHGFMSDQRDTVVKVASGQHRIVVQAGFNTGFGSSGPWEAIVLLPVDVEAGKEYRINGAVRDDLYFVWLEDAQSKAKASAEASAPYGVNRPTSTYVPIFIPVRR